MEEEGETKILVMVIYFQATLFKLSLQPYFRWYFYCFCSVCLQVVCHSLKIKQCQHFTTSLLKIVNSYVLHLLTFGNFVQICIISIVCTHREELVIFCWRCWSLHTGLLKTYFSRFVLRTVRSLRHLISPLYLKCCEWDDSMYVTIVPIAELLME